VDRYDPKAIEAKWQQVWEDERTYHTPDPAPGEEPPYPLGGMRAIFRLVDRNVDQLAGRQEKGPLVAVAKVDDQGVVTQVSVFRTPSPLVTAAITSALVNTPFQPARRNGAPVAMDYLVSVELL